MPFFTAHEHQQLVRTKFSFVGRRSSCGGARIVVRFNQRLQRVTEELETKRHRETLNARESKCVWERQTQRQTERKRESMCVSE
jgi:hypothetical protein